MDLSKRVLIIDDEPNVRLVFRTTLETAGYLVAEAGDGAAALAELARSPAHVILLDLKMPVLDGMNTLRQLRDLGEKTAVVVVTAHGNVPDAVEAMKLGAVDFIPKPVSPATLREVVARACATLALDGPESGADEPRKRPEVTLFADDIARTRRALERGEYEDAEFFLRIADALNPDSLEVARLRADLGDRKAMSEGFSFRALGNLLR